MSIINSKEMDTVSGTSEMEVSARPKRRHYTEGYKRKVVEEVSLLRSSGNGQIGDYLRKEGIYYSMVRK